MIRFFTTHPTAANLLMITILAAGLLSVRGLRRETFPDFNTDEVEIRVPYPGATAEDVEEAVCQRVEDAIDGVRYVEEVRSDARESIGIITVEMIDGGDFRAFKDEIDTEIAAIDDFPDEVEEPVITHLNTTDPVLSILVTGSMRPADLKLYAEGLKDRIQELPEVSLVEIEGFSDHQLRVELAAEALIQHNLSPADVASAISAQSVDLPAGTIEARTEEVLIRFNEERTTADALADLVVLGGLEGSEIRVRDLGTVVDDFEFAEEKIVMNGQRAALLRVEKTKSEDSLRVASIVKEFLEVERAERPMVEMVVTNDVSTLVAERLQLLLKNGVQGMLLVFAVMWLFFNSKLSFWVVASLPVSFLGAFFFLPLLDVTINMLSMVALLLGIGILMDDGIVIAENIATHRERGEPPLRAAIGGIQEVSGGVFSSFITTACVLGPLGFLSGKIGKVLEVVPIVLLVVLAVSLVEAFLILPSHLGHSLHGESKPGRIRERIDRGLEWVRQQIVGRLIDRFVRARYLWIGIVVAVFFGTLALPMSGVIKFQALPELDGDTISGRILLPQGTPLERTEEIVGDLQEALDRVNERFKPRQPNDQDLVKATYVKYNINADAFEAGPHVATVFADLLGAEVRKARLDDVFNAWREETGVIPDALAVSYIEPSLAPTGRNIEVRVRGTDLNELRDVSLEIKEWLSRFNGVSNLVEDLRPGKREFRVRFRPGVLGMELDSARMARQLRAAFQGEEAAEIQVGPESYEIEVRFDHESQDSIADFERFRFTLPTGEQVPLSSVAEVETTQGWSRIARIDRMRTASIRGDVDSYKTNTAAILGRLQAELLPELQESHPQVGFELEGEVAETGKTQGSMQRGLLIGVIGVFILLSFQFRSYLEPIIVMAAIPFSLIGVIWGHLILDYDLSLPSVLGFISLSGVVVNDSILLVLFLKKARAEGRDPIEAAGQASRSRFRAILMTSLTTIAGLVPLMFERSLQAQVLIPLAISIVFGLLASTILVLLVIPCLYVVLHDFGLTSEITESEEEELERVSTS